MRSWFKQQSFLYLDVPFNNKRKKDNNMVVLLALLLTALVILALSRLCSAVRTRWSVTRTAATYIAYRADLPAGVLVHA